MSEHFTITRQIGMAFADDDRILWTVVPKAKKSPGSTTKGPTVLPPIPDHLRDWQPPETFPDLSSARRIAVDVETYDPDLFSKGPGVRRDGYVVGVSVGTDDGFRAYYPVRHEIGPNLPQDKVFDWLSRELCRPNQTKVGAHLLYDMDYLTHAGVTVEGPWLDVQVAEPLIDENARSYSLETLGQKYLGEGKAEDDMTTWLSRAFGSSNIKNNIWRAPSAVVAGYAISDIDLPLRILPEQERIVADEGLGDIFSIESRLTPMLLAMRQRGTPIDVAGAQLVSDTLEEEARNLIAQLGGIDIWASASIARAFDKEGIEYPLTEKTKTPSFTRPWLEKHSHPLAQKIVEARGIDKFRTTFINGYLLNGHINGRIHCQFNQLRTDEGGAISGRFSSSNPNLQNIPARHPIFGPLIRALFVAEHGCLWWTLDWSQIEYRLIVHYAERLGLRGAVDAADAYRASRSTDFHQVVATLTGLARGDAKGINFGIAYGQGLALLCSILGVSIAEGRAILDEYESRAPFIRGLSNKVSDSVRAKGFLVTLLGRRRRFTTWEDRRTKQLFDEPAPGLQLAFLHKALNALIQGGAADIMKKAMVDLWESGLCADDMLGPPHLTVHDELCGSVPAGKEHLIEDVRHIMENAVKLNVPIYADGGLGANWKEAK